MTGEGWVWIGSDGVASTWLGSDNQAVDGLVAISPKGNLPLNTRRFRSPSIIIAFSLNVVKNMYLF